MRHSPHLDGLQEHLNRSNVNLRRREQLVRHEAAGAGQRIRDPQLHDVEHDPPDQAVAVGVQPARCQPQHRVPGRMFEPSIIDGVPRRPRRSRRDRTLPAGASPDARPSRRRPARTRPVGTPRRRRPRSIRSARDRAGRPRCSRGSRGARRRDEDVVHPHGDEVDADRVVTARQARDLQLGAHPVGRRDHDGLAVFRGQADQAREASDPADHLGAARRAGERRDPADRVVAGVDVDAGLAIGEPLHVSSGRG